MLLVTARINFESYPEKLWLFCACATVQLRNASRAHVKNWRWRYLMLRFILTVRGCLAGKSWRALCQAMRTAPFFTMLCYQVLLMML